MAETMTYDNLFAGGGQRTDACTLLYGENRARGTLLGQITLGAASKAAKSGGNTGDGTLTLDVTTPILANAQPGVYTVRIVRAKYTDSDVPTQQPIAELKDPKGNVLAVFDVLGSSGTTISNQVKFCMVDGSTAFVVGDGFDITIAAGSGKLKLCNSANLDGSQCPHSILAADTDASGADKACPVYITGDFNANMITFGGSDTAATHATALRTLGIALKTPIAQ